MELTREYVKRDGQKERVMVWQPWTPGGVFPLLFIGNVPFYHHAIETGEPALQKKVPIAIEMGASRIRPMGKESYEIRLLCMIRERAFLEMCPTPTTSYQRRSRIVLLLREYLSQGSG